MKDKEKKHKGESTIGKIIYGFMLFLPLFAIGSVILVNTFNNQAKQEKEITYKYETNEVNTISDLKIGNIYHVKIDSRDVNNSTLYFRTSAVYINNTTYFQQAIAEDKNYLTLQLYTSNQFRFLQGNSSNVVLTCATQETFYEFDFVYYDNYQIDLLENTIFSKCENIPINDVKSKDLDNVFYKSIEKVENSNLFNWATNNAIYTGILATANTLGITNTFIPMLMTYWLIISVLYFLYDIILMGLNILHKKIHELQESI